MTFFYQMIKPQGDFIHALTAKWVTVTECILHWATSRCATPMDAVVTNNTGELLDTARNSHLLSAVNILCVRSIIRSNAQVASLRQAKSQNLEELGTTTAPQASA